MLQGMLQRYGLSLDVVKVEPESSIAIRLSAKSEGPLARLALGLRCFPLPTRRPPQNTNLSASVQRQVRGPDRALPHLDKCCSNHDPARFKSWWFGSPRSRFSCRLARHSNLFHCVELRHFPPPILQTRIPLSAEQRDEPRRNQEDQSRHQALELWPFRILRMQ
ncbi:hypothetical protein E2P81_ATG00697 [Venturia nashicola]|nr:hypothetical protein E2P81_ATG00697 [Venturia nashicola]